MNVFTDPRQSKVLQKIQAWFEVNKPGPLHGIDHAIRDASWAKLLSEKERADPNITIPAALLHDMAIPKVGEHFYTLRDLRRSLSCFIPKEEYESTQALL